jgi:phospholipid/cholesterol/gamma-HCH transport system substrate-binding protein
MSDRRSDVQVGLFAVIGALLLAMLILIFGGFKGFFASYYNVTGSFKNAGGASQGTPVRLLGIEIGRVKDIALAPEKTGVIMTLQINSNVDIAADAPLSIRQEGFIANIYLEFGAGSKEAALPKDGSARVNGVIETFAFYLEGATEALTEKSAEINEKIGEVTAKLVALADNVNALTGDEKFRSDVKSLTANASVVAGQLKEKLPGLIDNLESAAKNAQASLDKASALFDTYQGLGEDLKKTNSVVQEQVIKQGANLDQLSASLVEAADNISKLSESLNQIAIAVKGGQGTVGKLFTDEELYKSTLRLIDTASNASKEFKDLAEVLKNHPDWIIKGPPANRK